MWDTERGKQHNQRLHLGVLLFATPIQYQLIQKLSFYLNNTYNSIVKPSKAIILRRGTEYSTLISLFFLFMFLKMSFLAIEVRLNALTYITNPYIGCGEGE